MTRLQLLTAGLATALSAAAATIPMDSQRGDKLFESQGCVQCHSLKGTGNQIANDLGRVLDRSYTPADLASTMWNHAPEMWKAIRERGLKVGDLDPQAAADLFASFYSARYFDSPGDAARGKSLFAAKSCEGCHGLTNSPNPAGRPVNQWTSLGDPVSFVGAMWVHSPQMRGELAKRGKPWPTMSTQELTDVLVYLRNTSPSRNVAYTFRINGTDRGAALAASKGCASCHKNPEVSLSRQIGPMTLTGVAATLWNHAGLPGIIKSQKSAIDPEEMRDLVGYYWANQFFQSSGDVNRGRRLFAAKRCTTCHTGSGTA
ncbi:MAG TPA: c-type cytochrome, partial [Bryobacteraceae bacterium]|nr:c-type cytochrome [Bryobacteraceae bacterium]